jgi:predicted PurR-regulated permease PerM
MSEPIDPTQQNQNRPDQSGALEPRVRVAGMLAWQFVGAVLATVVGLWALNQARGVVSMVAIAFFFSLALEPGVRSLVGRFGWRRGSATGVIYIGGLVFIILMVAVLIPAIVQLARLIGERGAEWLQSLNEWTSGNLGFDVPGTDGGAGLAAGAEDAISGFSDAAFGTVLGLASSGIGLVFNLATIAVFTFYFTADAPRIKDSVLRLFNPRIQHRIGWTWDQAITQTGGYFYSRLLLMLVNGAGFFFTMVLVGLPVTIALALALFGSFVSVFIPVVGTYIGGAIPIVLTLALGGLTRALIVLGYVLVYQQLENYWLSPKLSSKSMSLNGGVAFGAALAGGAIAGPMGAFTALPVAALISSFISNYLASYEVVYESPAVEKPSRQGRRGLRRRDRDGTEPEAG